MSFKAAETYKNVFSINEISGKITLLKELDYEKINFYQYTVTARVCNINAF